MWSWDCSSWKHDQFSSPSSFLRLLFSNFCYFIPLVYYLIVAMLVSLSTPAPKPHGQQHRAIPEVQHYCFQNVNSAWALLDAVSDQLQKLVMLEHLQLRGLSSTLSSQSFSLAFNVCLNIGLSNWVAAQRQYLQGKAWEHNTSRPISL